MRQGPCLAPQMIVARPFAQLFPPTVSNSTSMIYMTAHLRLPPSLYIRRDCTSDCGQILRVYTTCETTITAVPFMRDYTRKVQWLWYSRDPPLHPTPSHIQAWKKLWNNLGPFPSQFYAMRETYENGKFQPSPLTSTFREKISIDINILGGACDSFVRTTLTVTNFPPPATRPIRSVW